MTREITLKIPKDQRILQAENKVGVLYTYVTMDQDPSYIKDLIKKLEALE